MSALGVALQWLGFTLCLSMSVAGILVLFRYRRSELGDSLQFLQYSFILISVFVYYSLWSQILLPRFFVIDNVELIANVISGLGTPFFFIAVLMQLLWACRLLQRQARLYLASVSLLSIVMVLLCLNLGLAGQDPLRSAWSIVGVLFAGALTMVLFFSKGKSVSVERSQYLLTLSLLTGLIHLSYFTVLAKAQFYEFSFAALFYCSHCAFAVLYVYSAKASSKAPAKSGGLEHLLEKFGITKREAEVLTGIYAGKTNQEIANQLFLSLQTVKDHASRTYQKTFVKNRGQLIALVRDYENRAQD